MTEDRKSYLLAHKEDKRIYDKGYCLIHKERRKECHRAWRLRNRDGERKRGRAFYLAHRDDLLKKNKEYRVKHPTKIKGINSKHSATRHRELGFSPLNKPFEGSEGHHIDKERVIYIPKELHKSIYHSVLRDINMEEINKVAFVWVNQ